MKIRDDPEVMKNSPEFISVIFDENGHPIGTRPAKGPSITNLRDNGDSKPNPTPKPMVSPPLVVNKEFLEKLIVFVDRRITGLQGEIRQSNYSFQKILQDMKFNGQKQPIDSFTNSIQPLKEKIENFERMLNLQAESNQIINKKIDCLTAYLNDLSENMNEIESVHVIEKKLDTLGVYFDELSKKMSELKAVPEFDGEFEDLNLKISNLVKEIAETKTNEIVTAQNLKSLLEKISILSQEMKNQKLTDPLLEEKIDSLQGQIATINDSILQSNLQTQKTMAGIEEKMNGFSQIEKELDSLKNHTVHSIDELCETQNQLCESQKQMGNLLISQEQITKNIVNDAVLKIQKMLTKTKKRRVIKPTRAKVVRFLKKNFKIKPFSKVLVITDKHNSTFGKTLYEATRAVNKKSVLAVMENRTEKSSLDRQVIEAVKQSNYVFIIGKYSVKKVRKLSKTLPKARVMSVRRTLRYSVL